MNAFNPARILPTGPVTHRRLHRMRHRVLVLSPWLADIAGWALLFGFGFVAWVMLP